MQCFYSFSKLSNGPFTKLPRFAFSFTFFSSLLFFRLLIFWSSNQCASRIFFFFIVLHRNNKTKRKTEKLTSRFRSVCITLYCFTTAAVCLREHTDSIASWLAFFFSSFLTLLFIPKNKCSFSLLIFNPIAFRKRRSLSRTTHHQSFDW